MESTAYQSTNGNESVFVTTTAPNVCQNQISVKCDDKLSEITSIGLFDNVLQYGSKINHVSINPFLCNPKPRANVNILFSAMSVNEIIEKVDATYLKRFGYPELWLTSTFLNFGLMSSKVIALKEGNYNLNFTEHHLHTFYSELKVSSSNDYVLSMEDKDADYHPWIFLGFQVNSESLKISFDKATADNEDYVNLTAINAPPPPPSPPADASINYVFGGLICILIAFILHKIMKRSSYMDEESEFDDEERKTL